VPCLASDFRKPANQVIKESILKTSVVKLLAAFALVVMMLAAGCASPSVQATVMKDGTTLLTHRNTPCPDNSKAPACYRQMAGYGEIFIAYPDSENERHELEHAEGMRHTEWTLDFSDRAGRLTREAFTPCAVINQAGAGWTPGDLICKKANGYHFKLIEELARN
jgi:hypothetical protein